MVNVLTDRFTQFLGRYTYRQRFVFWAFLYFITVPIPNYWIIQELNGRIGRIYLQMQGIREDIGLWEASDEVLQRNEATASAREKELLTANMHQLADDYQLQIQDDDLKNQLAQIVTFSIWQEQANIIELKKSASLIMEKKDHSDELIKKVSDLLVSFHHDSEEIFRRLNSIYRYIHRYNEKLNVSFVHVSEQIEEARQKNMRFVEEVREILKSVENDHPVDPRVKNNLSIWATEAIEALGNCRDTAEITFELLLGQDRQFYWWLRIVVIGAFCFVSSIALFFVAFHVLTGHLLRLLEYIKGLTKGKFPDLIQADKGDEVSQISLAFSTLGQTIKSMVMELQSSSKRLPESTKKINAAVKVQTRILEDQKDSLGDLQGIYALVAATLFELSDTLAAFAITARERSQDDSGRNRLNRMLENMAILADTSADIVKMLEAVQESVLRTSNLSEFMTKTSDQVRVIAFNSAIEAANSSQHRETFDDIVLKIRRFADTISESTVAIKKIIDDMAANVIGGKRTAESCLKEIRTGANRLIVVGAQLSNIAHKGQEQFIEVQIINETLQDLIEQARCDITFIGNLRKSIQNSVQLVSELEKASSVIEADVQELCGIAFAFGLVGSEDER